MSRFDFYRLKNGVRVVLVPMAGVESVAVGVYVAAGSRYESARTSGISHFLEHMVFKGTKNFPSHKETSYLEGLGAMQNAWTSQDATSFFAKIPGNYWEESLKLVADLVINPLFPPKDLEIERGVIVEEINWREDRPDELVGEVLMELMYEANPLGRPVVGCVETVKALSREDFVKYHGNRYLAGGLVVAVAGKFATNKVKKTVESLFGGMPHAKASGFETYVGVQQKPQIRVKYKEKLAQPHIELAVRGVGNADPRRFALSVLTTGLGQGLSSRLFTELREKRGLCYAVSAGESRFAETGAWSVYAGLNANKLEETVRAILEQLDLVKTKGFGKDELAQAKEKIRGPLVFAMENPYRQMDFCGKQALDRPEEMLTYDEVIGKVMQIDNKDIQAVARDLFVKEKLNLAVVGAIKARDKERLAKILEAW